MGLQVGSQVIAEIDRTETAATVDFVTANILVLLVADRFRLDLHWRAGKYFNDYGVEVKVWQAEAET